MNNICCDCLIPCTMESYAYSTQIGSHKVELPATETPFCLKCDRALVDLDTLGNFELAAGKKLLDEGKTDGAVLRWLRKCSGLTIEELRLALNVDYSVVVDWESDVAPIDELNLNKFKYLLM